MELNSHNEDVLLEKISDAEKSIKGLMEEGKSGEVEEDELLI